MAQSLDVEGLIRGHFIDATLMLGAIKAASRVTVKFDVTLTASAVAVVASRAA